MEDLDSRVSAAVHSFWETRSGQRAKQGAETGDRDKGHRTSVTGGKQLDGFIELIRDCLIEGGVPGEYIVHSKRLELPGYYRPEKQWDLFIVAQDLLLAVVELKSHVGPSFGNNYNNRVEEAVGNAADIWQAYEKGAFPLEPRPWLGYFMLLEDTEKSTKPVRVQEPHFQVFDEFRDVSYAERYSETITRLIRERLYDSGCLMMAPDEKNGGLEGKHRYPNAAFGFERFVESMVTAVTSKLRG